MSGQIDVVAIVGSLRRESFTKQLVRALAEVAPPSLRIESVPPGELALYNEDFETDPPRPWAEFRARVVRAHAVLFATPEYNRSIPGVLKNALDVGSRPRGKSIWNAKPAAVLSASPGTLGGFGANHHLRQVLVYLNMPTMPQPEAYVGGVDRLLDERGQFKDAAMQGCGDAHILRRVHEGV